MLSLNHGFGTVDTANKQQSTKKKVDSRLDYPKVDFDSLTIVESQILRAYEIHPWYKPPGFSRLSSYRQSLKMTFYCQMDLVYGKMPQS